MYRKRKLLPLSLCLASLVVFVAILLGVLNCYVRSEAFSTLLIEQFNSVLGQRNIINGNIKLSIFPRLSIEIDDFIMEQTEEFAGAPPFITIEKAYFTIDLWELLSKKISIIAVDIVAPHYVFLENSTGNNWDEYILTVARFHEGTEAARKDAQASVDNSAAFVQLGKDFVASFFEGFSFSLDAINIVTISNATCLYYNFATEEVFLLEKVNMSHTGTTLEDFLFKVSDAHVVTINKDYYKPHYVGESPFIYLNLLQQQYLETNIVTVPVENLNEYILDNIEIVVANIIAVEAGNFEFDYMILCNLTLPLGGLDATFVMNSRVQVTDKLTFQFMNGEFSSKGSVELNSYRVPFSVTMPFHMDIEEQLFFNNIDVFVDGDHAYFPSASLTGFSTLKPVFEGDVFVEQFSLSRWLPFARRLPSGLQHGLNAIGGFGYLQLSANSVSLDIIKGSVNGIDCAGRVFVEDFSQPVVTVLLDSPYADINLLLPELLDDSVQDPVYHAPPAFELEDAEANSYLPDVGYNVVITAPAVAVWRFVGEGFSLSITPLHDEDGTLLDITAEKFYEGKVDAKISITDSFRFLIDGSKINLAEPAKLLAQYPAATGCLTGRLDAVGYGVKIQEILASLDGKMDFTLTNGFLAVVENSKDLIFYFKSLKASAHAKGIGLKDPEYIPDRLPWTGKWNVQMAMKNGLNWAFDGTGTLDFDCFVALPVASKNMQGVLTMDPPASMLDLTQRSSLLSTGEFAFDADEAFFALVKGKTQGFGINSQASYRMTDVDGKFEINGALQSEPFALRKTLPLLDITVWNTEKPEFFGDATFTTQFKATNSSVLVHDLQLQFDATKVTGTVEHVFGKKPLWKFNLALDELVTDNYLAVQTEEDPLWNLDWMHLLYAKGDLHVQNLQVKSIDFKKFDAAITLKESTFALSPISALVGDGDFTGQITGTITDALNIDFKFQANEVDLVKAVRRALQGVHIGGILQISTKGSGVLQHSTDIPAGLSGDWAIKVRDGFYNTSTKWQINTEPEVEAVKPVTTHTGLSQEEWETIAKATKDGNKFKSCVATGNIVKGVLYNDFLRLEGTGHSLQGKGSIDVPRQTLSYYIEATYLGISTIPITFAGPFDDIKVQVRKGRMVGKTLGNIGEGFVSLLANVLFMPFYAIDFLVNGE